MRKTTDTTPNIDSGPVPDLRTLADSELDAVTGGSIPTQHKWADISMVRALDSNLQAWRR
jgi:hypothetical protein